MSKIALLEFIISFVEVFRKLVVYAIIGRILLSWFSATGMRPSGRITQILYDVTEPFIRLARKLPHNIGMLDFAPLIAILGIDLLAKGLIILLVNLA